LGLKYLGREMDDPGKERIKRSQRPVPTEKRGSLDL
jgi:hypothetical protein